MRALTSSKAPSTFRARRSRIRSSFVKDTCGPSSNRKPPPTEKVAVCPPGYELASYNTTGTAGVGNVAGRTEGRHSGTQDDHRFVAHRLASRASCQREWLPLVLSGSRLRVPSRGNADARTAGARWPILREHEPHLPLLWRQSKRRRGRPRRQPAVRELPPRGSARRDGALLSAPGPRSADRCFLVQLPAYVSPDDIFTEYAYFSSFSTSWLEHVAPLRRRDAAGVAARTATASSSSSGSNDGYLLRNFVAAGVPVLGIEPAQNVAQVADAAGVRTLVRFFGLTLADRAPRARAGQPT